MIRIFLLFFVVFVPRNSAALEPLDCARYTYNESALKDCLKQVGRDHGVEAPSAELVRGMVQASSGDPIAAASTAQQLLAWLVQLPAFGDQLGFRFGFTATNRYDEFGQAAKHRADPQGFVLGLNLSLLGSPAPWLGSTTVLMLDGELTPLQSSASGGRVGLAQTLNLVRADWFEMTTHVGAEWWIASGYTNHWDPSEARPRIHGFGWMAGIKAMIYPVDGWPGPGLWFEGGQRFPTQLGKAPPWVERAYPMPDSLARFAGGVMLEFNTD